MTKSYNTIQNILQNKGENLNENDIKLIRNEYPLLSIYSVICGISLST